MTVPASGQGDGARAMGRYGGRAHMKKPHLERAGGGEVEEGSDDVNGGARKRAPMGKRGVNFSERFE